MAKKIIPEELNELIQEYLTDGVLTDKERQVILRKAEGMGLDRDEVDLYLDAQVQKIDQATDAAVRMRKGKTCPYCGVPIPQLTDKCPECGQFITPEANTELQDIIDSLEEALVDLKSGTDVKKNQAIVERYSRKAQLYYGSNPKIIKLLGEIEYETKLTAQKAKSESRKKGILKIITNKWFFYIIFCLGGTSILFIQTSHYEGLRGTKYREVQQLLNEEFKDKEGVEINHEHFSENYGETIGDVKLNSLKEKYLDAYDSYVLKFCQARKEEDRFRKLMLNYNAGGFLMAIISIIVGLVLIISSIPDKK